MKIHGAVLEESGRIGPYAESRPIWVGELELEPPGEGELLVRVEAAGVCHSDLSVVDGSRPRPLPMLLGHEAAGIVEDTGPGVEGFRIGQRVTCTFLPRCGRCRGCATDGRLPCEEGSTANAAGTLLGGRHLLTRDGEPVRHHLGVSGFATHAVVNALSCVPMDDDVPAEVAALLGCAVLTGGGAILNAGRPGEGDTVAVVGLGGVGMSALMVAVALGRGPVVGIDTQPAKLELARRLGATETHSPDAAVERGLRAQVVIEAVGHANAFETALALTAPGGVTVTVGLPPPDAQARIAPLVVTAEARTIIGSYLGSSVPRRDLPTFVQMWRDGSLPIESLVSDRISLDRINGAMDELASGTAMRQVIVF